MPPFPYYKKIPCILLSTLKQISLKDTQDSLVHEKVSNLSEMILQDRIPQYCKENQHLAEVGERGCFGIAH
jgi:hypothetical protein